MIFFSASLFVFIVFFNRYFCGLFLKHLRGKNFERTDASYEPAVTVIVPLYNEGRGIFRTIQSTLAQNYPPEKLNVYVVDDCSTDDSVAWACKAAALAPSRVKILKNSRNVGKRRSEERRVGKECRSRWSGS